MFQAENSFYNAYLILREMLLRSDKLKKVVLERGGETYYYGFEKECTISWWYPSSDLAIIHASTNNLAVQASHMFGSQGLLRGLSINRWSILAFGILEIS